ncbi:AAA family ATPase [Aerosakkonema funiforme]|uniref:AAA family ATPase n=1 Tax=Aerosakkonema funiforme TaxID=1246630 RepID=UPI0035B91034
MKIKEITYYDRELEWRYNPIQFSNLTLLVGISGVGKTRILKSIVALQEIAKGVSLNGVEWNITFQTNNNMEYKWEGKLETKKIFSGIISDEKSERDDLRIIRENLYLNNNLIIERNQQNEIKFKGKALPKLSPFQSVVQIFSDEEDVAPVQYAFNKIIYSDPSTLVNVAQAINYPILAKKYDSLEKIQESNLPAAIKLALVYNHVPEVFKKIKDGFIDIFTQVEDIQIKPVEEEVEEEWLSLAIAKYPLIHIKEIGVNNWISQSQISSGMFRTLMHISELYLSAEGSVILIDEFENSLGVNCIDVLTELLLDNRNLQFIITSHHPYIINKIGMEYWKIVTRHGGVVSARDAKDFNLGKSRHQAFLQLINLEEYSEGIKVG